MHELFLPVSGIFLAMSKRWLDVARKTRAASGTFFLRLIVGLMSWQWHSEKGVCRCETGFAPPRKGG